MGGLPGAESSGFRWGLRLPGLLCDAGVGSLEAGTFSPSQAWSSIWVWCGGRGQSISRSTGLPGPLRPAPSPLPPPRFHSPKGLQGPLGRKARSFSPPCPRRGTQRSTPAVGLAKTLPWDSASTVSSEIGGSGGVARWKCQGRWGSGERLLTGQRHSRASESESGTPLMGARGSGRSRSG